MSRARGIVTGYSSPEVTRLTGVPPSTLSQWVRSGVVRPSLRQATGKRATSWWSLQDLITVRTVRALRQAGCPMQTLKKVKTLIERDWNGIEEVQLCWTGDDVVAIDQWGNIKSAFLRPEQGILHFLVVPLNRWRTELEPDAEEVDLDHLHALARTRSRRPSVPVEQTKLAGYLAAKPSAALRSGQPGAVHQALT